MIINVKVIANSSKNEIENLSDSEYKIHLTAQREKGKANSALIEILAEHFKCKKTQIKIIKGSLSSKKVIGVVNS